MRLFDLNSFEEVLETLLRNKSRSLLTAFGIFWGIFLLVFFIGGGNGLKYLLSKNFDGVAQNSCIIGTRPTSIAYKGYQTGRNWELDVADAQLIMQKVPEVAVATSANMRYRVSMQVGNTTESRSVKGVFPEYATIDNPHLYVGRYINQTDIEQRRKVCVIGKNIAETFFPDTKDPCGRQINIGNIPFTIIGVSHSSNNMSIGSNAERTAVIPRTTMQQLYNLGTKAALICYTAKEGYTVTSIAKSVENVVKSEHLIDPNDKQAVMSYNMEEMFQMINALFRGVAWLIWIIGIGTLLSGAVGVSNIMMVTVRERTTEIGIRRAIGAHPSHILWQIIMESVVLTIMAGLSGIIFAILILYGVETVVAMMGAQANFQIPFSMAAGAAALLTLLGALAGLAPAYRALAIKPIDAMREE
ncbi:MAG: ABC transporter permease [Alloprevotella sp.]|nr:ABC transporter permease [Alloprevotella sp.]